MTIDEKRNTMKAFCKSTGCKRCPVRVTWDELCVEYKMENAPEGLIEKAYALVFGPVKADKEEKTMTITPEAIRKLVLDALKEEELYASAVTDDNYIPRYEVGYIQGIVDFAEKVIGMIEEGYRVAMGATKSFTKEGDAE